MKRLLHCIHSLNPEGGGPAHFIEQCALLQRDFNIEIEVLSLDPPTANWISTFPCKVHALGNRPSQYGYSKELVPWLQANHSRFDITIIDGLWQYSSLGTWLALKTQKAPYAVFPHGMLDPWFNEHYPLKALKKQLYWLLAERQVLKDARAVLFTSLEERDRARKSFFPYQVKEAIVNYGTLQSIFDLSESKNIFFARYPELLNKPFLLFMSRIHEKKGCDLLLEAFSKISTKYPNLHLVMAGPESEYSKLLKQKFQTIQESVTWTGMLGDQLKWGALAAAEALILPSHQENFARVVSEALSCGTPTLVSKRVNIWQELVENKAGIAHEDNLLGTEKLLSEWLSKSSEEKAAMRKAARLCYENNFNMAHTFPKYLELLASLI